ncbi:MAG: alpha/beta hydrolase, partial [Candidatus Neomarinimicrobiota bacterium]
MSKSVYKSREGRLILESLYRKALAAHLTPAYEQLFIPTEIAQTHVLRFGEKTNPPLIMIHGSVSNSATWLGNASDFIDHFYIYCVDIPGEPGLSEPTRMSLRSDAPNQWLTSLLNNLDIEKGSLVTMSMGSWYGLNFAIHNPEKVRALSMLTSAGVVPTKTSFIFKAIFYSLLGKKGQKLISKTVWYKAEVPSELLEFQSAASKYFNPVMEPFPIFSD